MSDKESDSTELSQDKQPNLNGNEENSNDGSENKGSSVVRKRGRPPKDSNESSIA